eukprot:8401723-Karenia_brevis.AAC.1
MMNLHASAFSFSENISVSRTPLHARLTSYLADALVTYTEAQQWSNGNQENDEAPDRLAATQPKAKCA